MPEISVVIITFDEEQNIERCLRSVARVADEIIVVDSYSTDRTEEIARKFNITFVQHPFDGHIEQKNYALSLATYPHVLALDADEALSEELESNILKIKENWVHDAYYFNRLTNYINKWVYHCGWYPDRKIRLWDKRKGSWGGINPHDQVIMQPGSSLAFIRGDLLHYSYYSIRQHVAQYDKFSSIMAQEYFKKRKHAGLLTITVNPLWKFIQGYFIKRGFLDGYYGFVICVLSAHATLLKFVKLRELYDKEKITIRRTEHKTIIISRTDSIGDVILTLPVAGVLKSMNPDCRLVFLGRTYTKAIIESSDFVDEFANWDTISALPQEQQVEAFRKINADAIVHVFPNKHISKVACKAGIPYRLGTSHVLHHWFHCNHMLNLGRKNSGLHESQLNLELISKITGITQFPLCEIPKYYGMKAKESISNEILGLLDKNRFKVILHPKSKGSAREWGLDNFSRLIELLPEDQFQIFLSGTKDEASGMQEFRDKHKGRLVDITGILSLPEFIKFISLTDALVAASTGPLHIASSLGIMAVGLYAPMRPIHPGRWMPVGNKARYLVLDKKCDKCRQTGNCECIQAISPEKVAEMLKAEAAHAKK
ncbi:MAG TPA: glycosyltransferase [Chitinispirillaceae bacterium]|nr:glycosyltransferase [Chitinispirillaceae bacterium]